jgi:polyhydroxybutyrate depolymerase
MGGGMSNHVACNMSDVFAAVAPAAMDLNRTNSVSCNIVRPISVIMFRGTTDNICPYAGGESFMRDGLDVLGAENNFKFWAEKDGCTDKPTTNSSGCQEYSNCNGGAKVVLCTDKNGANGTGNGHDQGNGSIGWPFLKQFELK